MLLLTHGDIESNPGPKHRTSNYFSCCHWNVNSIMALIKLSLLSAYNTLHKLDVICISETYLDKSADNDAFSIGGYNIIRADQPHNQKRGSICGISNQHCVYGIVRIHFCLVRILPVKEPV